MDHRPSTSEQGSPNKFLIARITMTGLGIFLLLLGVASVSSIVTASSRRSDELIVGSSLAIGALTGFAYARWANRRSFHNSSKTTRAYAGIGLFLAVAIRALPPLPQAAILILLGALMITGGFLLQDPKDKPPPRPNTS